MGFEDMEKSGGYEESGDEKDKNGNVKRNESEDEGEDAEGNKIELGPQYTLKEQFEKDKVLVVYNSQFNLYQNFEVIYEK